ncbi:MAG TPA: hypothetical protein VIN05_08435 [Roseovarius sp.]
MIIHDTCVTRDLEFDGTTVPADKVHAAPLAALAFFCSEVIPTDTFVTR